MDQSTDKLSETSQLDTSMQQAQSASNEQQRRNKKRKPPNYYQSAEYAAIIKQNDDLLKSKQQLEQNQINANKNNEDINSKLNHNSQIVNNEIIEADSCFDFSDRLADVKLNDANTKINNHHHPVDVVQVDLNKNNDESNKIKQAEPTTSTSTSETTSTASSTKPASSPWSSLFKSAAAAEAAAAQQTSNAKISTQKSSSSSSKQPLTASVSSPATTSNSTSSTNSHAHLNGHSNESSTNNNNSNSSDVLKVLGTFFKQCELKHSAPALQPRGIRNRQNWCYVNATLQALLACPPFYNLIKNVYNKIKNSNASTKNVPCIAALGRFISEFKVMVRNASSTSSYENATKTLSTNSGKELVIGGTFEIDYFYDTLANLQQAEPQFKSGRQEDAQEFLSFLLNRLHEEMIKCLESLNPANATSNTTSSSNTNNVNNNNTNEHSKLNGNSSNTNNDNQENEDEDEWKEVGKKNKAFVTRKVIRLNFGLNFLYVYLIWI